MTPTIGRIVHVQQYLEGSPHGAPQAAIITAVPSPQSNTVSLYIFPPGRDGFPLSEIPYDVHQMVTGWAWCWPPLTGQKLLAPAVVLDDDV